MRTTDSMRVGASRRMTQITECSHLPYEVLAVAAEGGLLEESGHKAMILDHVDILLLEGALPAPQFLGEIGVAVAGPEGVLARVVRVVRHGSAAAAAVAAATVADLPIDDESTRRQCQRRWCPAPLAGGSSPRTTPTSPEPRSVRGPFYSRYSRLRARGSFRSSTTIELARSGNRARELSHGSDDRRRCVSRARDA